MTAAALSFLLVVAVGGMVCGLTDLALGVVDHMVATCVIVSKLGGVNHYGSVLALSLIHI